jgi:hypothetical protein
MGATAVEVDDLRITYGDVIAVDGLSFRAAAGEVVALLARPSRAFGRRRRGGSGSSATTRSPSTPRWSASSG